MRLLELLHEGLAGSNTASRHQDKATAGQETGHQELEASSEHASAPHGKTLAGQLQQTNNRLIQDTDM